MADAGINRNARITILLLLRLVRCFGVVSLRHFIWIFCCRLYFLAFSNCTINLRKSGRDSSDIINGDINFSQSSFVVRKAYSIGAKVLNENVNTIGLGV